ncbi:cytochrome-c oxidase fixP chain [Bdellovibrio bacteriovorus W]|nr:cytochrome-c oxidase fixP chain [Bdellovibrio bacteriovorus W]
MSDDKTNFEEYDGIIEHDNPLPTWWLWSFLISIIFAFIYFIHYELGGGGHSLEKELEVAMQQIETTRQKANTSAPLETEESLAAAFGKDGVLELGAAQYASKCAACHGNELQGLIGPNLVDNYWVHGKGTRMDILNVVREGVASKGMPPWGPVMKREELYAVTAFLFSKKGTKVEGGKAAEGNLVE